MALSVGGVMSTCLFGTPSVSTSTESQSVSKTSGSKSDAKLKRIINKFKAGKKLSAGEMSYVSKVSPGTYQKILRITKERENLEERMEMADSKEEVAKIVNEVMGSIDKLCGDDEFERTARVNQYNDAYTEYSQSDEYQDKPTSEMEAAEQKQERMDEKFGVEEQEELQKKLKKRRRKQEQRDMEELSEKVLGKHEFPGFGTKWGEGQFGNNGSGSIFDMSVSDDGMWMNEDVYDGLSADTTDSPSAQTQDTGSTTQSGTFHQGSKTSGSSDSTGKSGRRSSIDIAV